MFGADQLDRSSGLGMALSGVFLGMHGRNGHERAKEKKVQVQQRAIWDILKLNKTSAEEEKVDVKV